MSILINRYVSVSSGVVMQPLIPLASILELKGFAINTTLQIAEHYLRSGTSNLFHRGCGPARYYEDLFVVCEEYWLHGNRHREDGPATIQYERSPIEFEPTLTTADRITEYMRQKHTRSFPNEKHCVNIVFYTFRKTFLWLMVGAS